MNLITKRNNKWKDTVSDIMEREERDKYFPLIFERKTNKTK